MDLTALQYSVLTFILMYSRKLIFEISYVGSRGLKHVMVQNNGIQQEGVSATNSGLTIEFCETFVLMSVCLAFVHFISESLNSKSEFLINKKMDDLGNPE